MNLKQMISSEIKNIYPNLKPYLADRYADKYVSAVLEEIRRALLLPANEREEELSFNFTRVYNACGDTHNKVRVFSFMDASAKTRLVTKTFSGNSGRYNRVILNPIYKDQIMYELLDVPTQAMTARELSELEQQANRRIAVDPASLASFIQQTEQTVRSAAPGTRYYDQLTQNLLRAREIYINIKDLATDPHVIEYWATADTGREYGHYNSLQRQNQQVRHAALGHCHKYDFQAHSFAVMASLAKSIQPDIKISQIEEYIRYRSDIRQRIAKEVGVPEDTIKQVFTSLGFGAKPINNPFNSIRKRFYSEDAYNRLLNQTEFKFIIEDLKQINQLILTHFPNEDFDWLLNCRYQSKEANGHKKSDSKRLAWIYQNSEAYITRRFANIIQDLSGIEPLMTVHDCVYYRQKIPLSVILDAQVMLREEYTLIRVEHEATWPIGTDEQFDNRFADYDQVEQQHRRHIEQEEQTAQGYNNQYNQQSTSNVSDAQQRIERIKWQQELARTLSEQDYEYEYEYDSREHK